MLIPRRRIPNLSQPLDCDNIIEAPGALATDGCNMAEIFGGADADRINLFNQYINYLGA